MRVYLKAFNLGQTFVVTNRFIIQAEARKPDQFNSVGVFCIPVPGCSVPWWASGSRRYQLSLFSSWAGVCWWLNRKHPWSSGTSLDEGLGKIKWSRLKLCFFTSRSIFFFALEKVHCTSSQYCSHRDDVISVVLPVLLMSRVWQWGVTETSSLELLKEQGEPFKYRTKMLTRLTVLRQTVKASRATDGCVA